MTLGGAFGEWQSREILASVREQCGAEKRGKVAIDGHPTAHEGNAMHSALISRLMNYARLVFLVVALRRPAAHVGSTTATIMSERGRGGDFARSERMRAEFLPRV